VNRSVLLFIQNSSSCRYVAELVKMKEMFIIPLLHPLANVTSTITSLTMLEYDDMSRLDTPVESLEHLPIASRFLLPTGLPSDTHTALDHTSRMEDKDASNMDNESLNSASKYNNSRSPYSAVRMGKTTQKKNQIEADLIANVGIAPHQIPADLRQCLEVIEDSILEGHIKLSEGLRKRYDGQYPLVRTFADIFVAYVRLSMFPSCCPDLIALTFVLVSHFPRLCRLYSTFGARPRASQRCDLDNKCGQTWKKKGRG
jgi:hypothetical protein